MLKKDMIELCESEIKYYQYHADAAYSHESWDNYHDCKGRIAAYEKVLYYLKDATSLS